jgi:hypothetical protein
MKKYSTLLLSLLATMILFSACKKEKTDEITNVTLDVSVNAGEMYKLDLSKYGDADDNATITTQAVNFSTSEVVKTGIIGEYNFMKAGNPKAGGNGNETVILKVAEGTGGGPRCGNGNPPPN